MVITFEENKRLGQLSKEIERELVKQKVFVNAGVPLKGSCDAGKEAHPKLE
ncbi:MAG: hypothetical protein JRN20_14620 [Nitrososphaerota archaeon]|nr:hypothetical protein [Nitrososphaerota archaeon]